MDETATIRDPVVTELSRQLCTDDFRVSELTWDPATAPQRRPATSQRGTNPGCGTVTFIVAGIVGSGRSRSGTLRCGTNSRPPPVPACSKWS